MRNRGAWARKAVWLWLVCAWVIVPTLTVLAVRWFGDYSVSALWRWAVLVLWTLIAPTIAAVGVLRSVRALQRNAPAVADDTIQGLLAPAWQMPMLGVLTLLAVIVLAAHHSR